MKRFIAIFIVLLTVVLAGLLIGPGFVDWNKYKPQIIAQLEAATGHDYEIGGALEFAILPYPRVLIEDFKMAQPPEQGGAVLVTLERAAASVALLPMMRGEVIIESISLSAPQIAVDIDADGTPSWMTPEIMAHMDRRDTGSGGGAFMDSVTLDKIEIRNGTVDFADRRSGKELSVSGINLVVRGDTVMGPYTLSGDTEFGGHKYALALKIGRLDRMAESLPLQGQVEIRDLRTKLEFSGVAALTEAFEAQGDLAFQTDNMEQLAKAFGADIPDNYAKALTLRGVITASPERAAYRDMQLSFGGFEADGSAGLDNIQSDEPLMLTLDLRAGKAFALDDFIPGADSRADGRLAAFLPESVTLPFATDMKIDVRAPAFQYNGGRFEEPLLAVEKKGADIAGTLSATGPGNSAFSIEGALRFGSVSRSQQDGAVTLSDPVGRFDFDLGATELIETAALFINTEQAAALGPVLSDDINMSGRLVLRPQEAGFESAVVRMMATRFDLDGAYALRAQDGRDRLTLNVNTQGINLDSWMAVLGDRQASGPVIGRTQPAKPAGQLVRETVEAVSLPFDLVLSARAEGGQLGGEQYDSFSVTGRLTGNHLHLDTAGFEDGLGNRVRLAGTVGALKELAQVDMTLQVATPDLDNFLQSFGVDTAPLPASPGRAEMLAEFKGHADELAFVTNISAFQGTLETSGTLADVLETPVLSDLIVRLRHPNYVQLVQIFNPSFSSAVSIKKSTDIYAGIKREGPLYQFTELRAEIGPAVVTGNVAVNNGGARPAIAATLDLGEFPFGALMGVAAPQRGTVAARPLRGSGDVRWSRNAINTDWMHGFDLDLKATAQRLSYGHWALDNAGINLTLRNGTATITQIDGNMFGGQAALSGSVKSSTRSREPLALSAKVLAQNVDLERFVQAFSGSRLLRARGDMTFEASFETTGLSPAALIFDLGGQGTAQGSDFVFEGFDLARLSRAVAEPGGSMGDNFSRILSASMAGGQTNFNTLDAAFAIREGIVRFSKLDLRGDEADVISGGQLNLPLWTMDMTSRIELKEPEDAPPVEVTFKGPLDNPARSLAQNALQSFFQRQLEGLVIDPLLQKLDPEGVLPGLPGLRRRSDQPQRVEPAPLRPDQQQQGEEEVPPEEQPAEQPAEAEPSRQQVRPEDVFRGILEGVIDRR